MTFSNIETLIGNSASDTLDYSTSATARNITLTATGTDGFNLTDAAFSGTFRNINTLIGSAGSDTLTGADLNNTWKLEVGSLKLEVGSNTLGFSNFETLQGGSASDTFNIVTSSNLTLRGGAGDDTLALNQGATFGGTFNGEGGNDVVSYAAWTGAVDANLATNTATNINGTLIGIEGFIGGAGDDTLTGDANNNILNGGAGKDTLIGGAGDDTYKYEAGWGVDNPIVDSGGNDTLDFSALSAALAFTLNSANLNVTDGTNIVTYNGTTIENLIGGAADDLFTFNAGANITGLINGGAGNDTLNFATFTSALDIKLTALGDVDGFNGTRGTSPATFANINSIVGGTAADKITGLGAGATWNINPTPTPNTYVSTNTLTFLAFENLNGGSGADTFVFNGNASVNGSVDGGAGSDTLNYSNYTSAVTVNFPAQTASGVSGTVKNFENVISNTMGLTLTGDENDNIIVGSAGNDTLRGMGGDDTLIGLGGDDVMDGGAGIDTVDYSGSSAAVFVNLTLGIANGTAIGNDTLSNIENVIGSAFDDMLIGNAQNNTLTGGAGADTLVVGAGDDVYVFGENSGNDTVIEQVGEGNDTFDFSSRTSNVVMTIDTPLANVIENIIGARATTPLAHQRGSARRLRGRQGRRQHVEPCGIHDSAQCDVDRFR